MQYILRSLSTWPRESTVNRKRHPFATEYNKTLRMLGYELQYLKAEEPVIIEIALRERDIRIDGLPRADAPNPSHPGVIVSFKGKHGHLKFMCDDCRNWQDNVHAIALTLERLRLADRYGVTRRGEQYTGWKALPGAIVTPAAMTLEEAAQFVNSQAGRVAACSSDLFKHADLYRTAYRVAVQKLHPDKNAGTTPPEWHRLQQAAEILNRHHGVA